MARFYDEQLIRDIESRVDIVELIGETVTLTRKGNRYWGLCPFHGEKTPSFCVSRDRQMYYCFGCHEGGNVYSFLMKNQGMEFVEALRYLAQRAGVKLPEPEKRQQNQEREEFLRLHQAAAGYFRRMLKDPAGKAAREYLERRGVTEESVEKFGLGFATENWSGLSDYLTQQGFSRQQMEKSGLVRVSDKNGRLFDLLRNRVIFPIYQYDQSVIAFGGRTMEKDVQPKYLNSPETPIFSKRRNLYGLSFARSYMREQSQAFLVEGYMDCLKMSQAGIRNVVASLGTAFTGEQASLLHRYVERVVLLYDGDEAGQRETIRASGLLQQEGIGVEVLTLPDGMDPDEFVSAYGKSGFDDFVKDNRQSVIAFKLNRWLNNQSGRPDREKTSQLLRELRADFKRLPGEMERDYHVELLTMKLGIPENLIRRELNPNQQSARAPVVHRTPQKWDNKTENFTPTERVVAAMLKNQELFTLVAGTVGIDIFGNEEDRALLKMAEEQYRERRLLDLNRLRYEAMEAGLEGRLARLQMIIENNQAANRVLTDDFIVRIRKMQEKGRWEQLMKKIQQISEQDTNANNIRDLLLQINQVFYAERKGDRK